MKRLIVLLVLTSLLLTVSTLYAQTDKPEIFVQTGHMHGVEIMTVSPDGRYFISAERQGYQKIWEMSSGRELRTLNFGSFVNGLVFIDNDRFIILGENRSEIYNVAGEKLETLHLTGIQKYCEISITPNLKYIYTKSLVWDQISLFDVKDGAKIRLPEDKDDYYSPLINLGKGFFGFFYDSYRDDKSSLSNIGNTAYVIYDEDLQVRKRGLIKGSIFIGGGLRVDADLKYVYKRNYGDNPSITKYDLEKGTVLNSIRCTKETTEFELLPDNRIILNHSELRGDIHNMVSDNELTIFEFLENGAYKEKKLLFKDLNTSNPLYITPQGQIIVNSSRDLKKYDFATDLKLFDITTGKGVRKFGIKPVVFQQAVFADGRLLNIEKGFHLSSDSMQVYYNYNIWDLKKAGLDIFNYYHITQDVYKDRNDKWLLKKPEAFYKQIPPEFFAHPYKGKYKDYYDRANNYPIFLKGSTSEYFDFKLDNTLTDAIYISVENILDKTEAARFYAFSDGEWIAITPEGYFNASPNGAKYLNVRVGNQVYSIDNFYEKYYNPAYVASVLQGNKVEPVADIRQGVALPPEVKIVSPETNSELKNEEVTITVSAKDIGGGIDEIRLYHNGKAIGEETRGINIVPKGNESTKSYTITLVDGLNTFRAIGFSRDRTESNPSEIIIKLLAPEKEISMYVFAVGINKYKNPALNLNYAENDAKGIVDFFRESGTELFKKVEIKDIYNEQATKEGILAKLKELENTKPQDAVIIYLAGHGENINEKWYFIPHELTYPEREDDVKEKAISSDELSNSIQNIKAQKVLVLIDACKSGAVLLAFRGFEDRKALAQLSRSTGVHIVAASTKDQFATEVTELGHGVFTYTLLEGLNGKAVNIGETVTVRKLMSYIEEQLPELTKKYRQEAQYPVVDSKGMDFPLVRGK